MKNGLRTFVAKRASSEVRPFMVGRIVGVHDGRTSAESDEEVLALWYGLGRAYGEAGGGGRRAWKLGLTVVCAVGALVLLSAPVFGTAWAGPVAPVIPVAAGLVALRRRWEYRIGSGREGGAEPPALGLREDAAYRVFPREMTVPVELSMRRAYLEISNRLLVGRYGRGPGGVPEPLRRRAARDLRGDEAIVRKSGRRR